MRRWLIVTITAFAVLVLAWFGYQAYLHVGDDRATQARMDAVGEAWEAAGQSARDGARTDASVVPPGIAAEPFFQMGTTSIGGHRAEGSTVVVAAGDGTCGAGAAGATRWQAFARETDDVVVVLLRPATSWLPDVPGGLRMLRGEACAGVGIEVPVRVQLAAPLGDRLLVDAYDGTASVGDRVTTGQVTEPQDG